MPETSKSTVNWAMLCHVAGLAMYIGIPFGNIIVPLIIWLLRKDSSSAVDAAGREALNFNISFTLYGIIAGLLCYVLIGFVLVPILVVAHIVLVIQATLKANKNEPVHYPLTLRFIV
jgi:uncharacterized Tic20 family protein